VGEELKEYENIVRGRKTKERKKTKKTEKSKERQRYSPLF
jgi:hypothetical protein